MILARADRELRALVDELRDDAAVAKHLSLELDGLIEAAVGECPRNCVGMSELESHVDQHTHHQQV